MKFEMTEQELKYFEQIQNYVAGKMEAAEEKAFLAEMSNSSTLAKEVEIYRNLIPVINPPVEEENALRNKIPSLGGKCFNTFWTHYVYDHGVGFN